jgi:hypothetical protein
MVQEQVSFWLKATSHYIAQKDINVKVSHIAKISFTWALYKSWYPLLSQGVFWEWVRPMDFYMVSDPQVSCDDGSFPPVIVHVFGH